LNNAGLVRFNEVLLGLGKRCEGCMYASEVRVSHMLKYEFNLVLRGKQALTEELAEAVLEAGADDGTPSSCEGVCSIAFHREAESLEKAIHSAIGHVTAAGYPVERVEIPVERMPQPV